MINDKWTLLHVMWNLCPMFYCTVSVIMYTDDILFPCYTWCSYTLLSWSYYLSIILLKERWCHENLFYLLQNITTAWFVNLKIKKKWWSKLIFFKFPPPTKLYHFVVCKPKKSWPNDSFSIFVEDSVVS